MGFTGAISSVYSNYATFSGRASRPEYWFFVLFIFLVEIALFALAAAIDPGIFMIILYIFIAGTILPALAVTVRRLHDQDKSGWWILIDFVPVVGPIWLLVLLCMPSTPGPNRFGG